MHTDRLVLVVAFLFLSAGYTVAQGQDTDTEKPAEWLIGVSLGVPGAQSSVYPQLTTFGLQFTELRDRRLGGDIAIGTMPYLIANGVMPFGFRGDFTIPLVSPHLILLPSAGVSAIGVLGAGGGGGTMGINGGIAAVLRLGGIGLRTGITLHKFLGLNEPIWLAEIGFVSIGLDPP